MFVSSVPICERCGNHIVENVYTSVLNSQKICKLCYFTERYSDYFDDASYASYVQERNGNKEYKGMYYNYKQVVTIDSLNAKNYIKRIVFTRNYVLQKFSNNPQKFNEYLMVKYKGLTAEELRNHALNCSELFLKICMKLSGESVNLKTTACHSFAGAVSAVLTLLGVRNKVYTGFALRRDRLDYRDLKLDVICKNGLVMCNHCWVYSDVSNRIYDYFNGYKKPIDYVAYMEVI